MCRLIMRPAGVQIVADLLLLAVEHAAAVEGDGVVRPRRLKCLEVVRVLDPLAVDQHQSRVSKASEGSQRDVTEIQASNCDRTRQRKLAAGKLDLEAS